MHKWYTLSWRKVLWDLADAHSANLIWKIAYIFSLSAPLLLDIWKKLSSLLGTQVDGDCLPLLLGFVHGKDNQKQLGLFLFTFFGAYGPLRVSWSSKRFLLMPSCHLFALLHIFRKSSPSALRNPPGQSHWSIYPTPSQFSSSTGLLEGVMVVESPPH